MEQQLSYFPTTTYTKTDSLKAEWGTFKDSLRAPVHRWFTYPAGFSYKAVEYAIKKYDIKYGQTIYDPFMGSGTTNLVAKTWGINSVGVEAHPFVYKIAQTKLFWDIDIAQVHSFINHVQNNLRDKSQAFIIQDLSEEFPELILKCYEKKTLYDLWTLREIMAHYPMSNELRRFFFVVITALLRGISTAATGWPYIAPRKKKMTSFEKNVIDEFSSLAWRMAQDIEKIKGLSDSRYLESKHHLIQGDSRNTTASILSGSVDHVFTSPPYLNNFDYADRTRLELYFWGEASTWGEISSTIRTKLITSATTQINRSNPKYKISDAFRDDCPETARFVENAKNKLADIRKTKGGKKSYDLLVTGYFNDMHQIVKDVYRVLRPKTHALFVLGDSAPYGIHIPTDTLIGDIGVAIGFENYTTEILRTRGGKWKANPQRHSVALRESIIILYKG